MEDQEKTVRSITLIDDDEIAHFIFAKLVAKLFPGVEVKGFPSAKLALQQIRDNSFSTDAILLDINMPHMNGWEFLDHLKSLGVSIPVYMLSSSESPRDKNKVHEYECVQDYFVKPLTQKNISVVLEKINCA
jgi:CheY-like chemotaxis protein